MTMAEDVLSNESIAQVRDLVQKQIMLEDTVAALEHDLEVMQEELRRFEEELVPTALEEFGLTQLRMKSGAEVNVKAFIKANIPKEKKGEGIAWLRDNGFGDVVKHVVAASFGRGEDEEASALATDLRSKGMDVEDKEAVSHMTLGALVREQEGKGVSMNDELLGIRRFKKAKITRPKK